jgi:NAD(P)-dependent dehydrogenase (short-subunit alcohol dehydrogenase family)
MVHHGAGAKWPPRGVTINTRPGYIGTDIVKTIRPDVLEKSWRCARQTMESMKKLPSHLVDRVQ